MTAVGSIINASMALQGAALLGENARVANKALGISRRRRQRSRESGLKDIVGLGVTNVVGVSLIKAQGELASGL